MKTFLSVIDYIVNLGAAGMLPIVVAILSIISGVKVGRAIRSGIMIGVGFIGLGLIVDLMNSNLGPAAAAMSDRFGLTLSVVDIGWPGASPMTWASEIATVAIPVAILVNIIMLVFRLTRVVNIDIWNIWHMTFTGAIAYIASGNNFLIGMIGVIFHAIIAYKLGDWLYPIFEDYFGLEGITVPHGTSAYMAPFAVPVDMIIDKIPVIRDITIDSEKLEEKLGVFGEPILIGAILGAVVALLAGYDFQGIMNLGVQMAAVMVLMPKVVKCIMDGLLPMSNAAKTKLQAKFQGEEYYIGIDPAVTLGDSQVVAAGLLFIPITLLLAVIIPGNRILPFGDLATIGFFIAGAVAIHNGNIFRTLFSGTIIMSITIWISNQMIDVHTKLAMTTNSSLLKDGATQIASLDQGGSPITYILKEIITRENILGLIIIAGIYIASIIFMIRFSNKKANESAE